MKKLIVAAALTAAGFASPALAQNTTGEGNSDSVVLTANIPAVCTVAAPSDVTLSNPTVNGASTSIGNVDITCNDPEGFTLTTTSANPSPTPVEGSAGGLLVPTDSAANTSTIPYRVSINGASLFGAPKQASDLSAGGPGDFVGGQSLPAAATTSTMNGPAFAGIYQDTVTFTIASN